MTFWLIIIAGLLFFIAGELHEKRPKKEGLPPFLGLTGWDFALLAVALCAAAVLA
jgi:hypothetical protein